MIDLDKLIGEVAAKHRVLITQNDPILVTVTLNELVFRHYVELLSAQNEEDRRALTAALLEHLALAKDAGSQIINEAAEYVAKSAKTSIDAAMAEHGSIIRQQLNDAQTAANSAREAAASVRTARSGSSVAAMLSGVAAGVSLLVLAIVLLH